MGADGDLFIARPRSVFMDIYAPPEKPNAMGKVRLKESGFTSGRKFAAGYDIYFLEQEWRNWLSSKGEHSRQSRRFIRGFCEKLRTAQRRDCLSVYTYTVIAKGPALAHYKHNQHGRGSVGKASLRPHQNHVDSAFRLLPRVRHFATWQGFRGTLNPKG